MIVQPLRSRLGKLVFTSWLTVAALTLSPDLSFGAEQAAVPSTPQPLPVPTMPPPATLLEVAAPTIDKVGALSGVMGLDGWKRAAQALVPNSGAQPLHVIYIGDSHTAADHITGALREALQARLGNAGRGLISPGMPYAGFSPRGISIEHGSGWSMVSSFPRVRSGVGPFGLSGYRAEVSTLSLPSRLTVPSDGAFDRIVVCASSIGLEAQLRVVPEGLIANTTRLAGSPQQVSCDTLTLRTPVRSISIGALANSGPVGVTSIGVYRHVPGVVLSSFGVPGSQLQDFAARNSQALAAEIGVIPPTLIILAYGTNEGFSGNVRGENYQSLLVEQIERLRTIAPQASFLIVGAPDANRTNPKAIFDGCDSEVSSELVKTGAALRFAPPKELEIIRQAQRNAAQVTGSAFWDWAAVMGGACSADRLARQVPRMVASDRVHFSQAGGRAIGRALGADLLAVARMSPVRTTVQALAN